MRKILPILVFLVLSAVSFGARVVVGNATVPLGSSNAVSMMIENAENIGSMDLAISYDPSIIKAVSVEKGSGFKGMFSSNTENEGLVLIAFAAPSGINGDAEIARIVFNGLKEGETALEITNAVAYDANTHVDVRLEREDGMVVVEKKLVSGNMVVYGIAGLVVVAIAALVLFRKKKVKKKRHRVRK